MMNITGHYKIQLGEKIIKGNNLITVLGESFFMNRMINNEFEPLKYIVLGNSSIPANKHDIQLGNETVRKNCVCEANLSAKQIILYCSCTSEEILGATEIGVANDEILISHDIFEVIDDEFITDNIDSVEISYAFDFSTSSQKTGWKYYTSGDTETAENIDYVNDDNRVTGVFEKDTNSGYRSVRNIEELQLTTGAYYYENASNTLFIRTTRNDDPNSYRILVSY